MAVTDVNERFQDRRSNSNERGRSHVRVFDVFTDSVSDGTQVALTADDGSTSIPSIGDAHPVDTYALCRNIDAEPKESEPKKFVVTVTYNTQTNFAGINFSGSQTPQQYQSPLDEPYEITFGFNTEEEVLWEDFSTTPKEILNSAGQMFDPPVTRQILIPTMTVTRSEATFHPSKPINYVNRINSEDWTLGSAATIAKGIARCAGITGVSRNTSGVTYWRVTYEFHFKAEKWNPVKILDQGLFCKNSNGDFVPAEDDNGEAVTFPVNLDGNGFQVVPFSSPRAFYLEFNIYEEVDFNNLALFS